jgi:medium-chain acyl-[acyl-carrier-protein] hydrolase
MMPLAFASNSDGLWFEHLGRAAKPLFRLFCFAHAGGNAHAFRNWQRSFPHQVDLCLVHLPGHGKRMGEQAFTQLFPLVASVADQIGEQSDPPFAFYGHSMGALISFELGRELFRRHGQGPQRLFLSGHRAPHLPNPQSRIFDLPEGDFVERLKRLNGTPAELLDEPQTREFFLAVFRADFEIVDTYQFPGGSPVPCPLTVYGGLQDQSVPSESVRAWRMHTSAECSVSMFSGDHFFVYDPASNFLPVFRDDVLGALNYRPAQKA